MTMRAAAPLPGSCSFSLGPQVQVPRRSVRVSLYTLANGLPLPHVLIPFHLGRAIKAAQLISN